MRNNLTDFQLIIDSLTKEDLVSLLTGADFWRTRAIPSQNIPAIKLTDGPNGARGESFKNGPKTACFPVGISLASTWNPPMVHKAGQALGKEARLKGAKVLLAPTINLQRTTFNGRNFECYSEDPWLSGDIAVAMILGIQSQGVAATLKHFVGNESEYRRMVSDSVISERALRELYLLPFERAVKEAGALAVMTSYNKVNGEYVADSEKLIKDLLRNEWKFNGLVMTDWGAHHDTINSVKAGCDLEMPGPTRERGERLLNAIHIGKVNIEAIKERALNILQFIDTLGAFSSPEISTEQSDDLFDHRVLIRNLGSEGAVLLKNSNNLLPLDHKPGQKIALIGTAAKHPLAMGGSSQWNDQLRPPQ